MEDLPFIPAHIPDFSQPNEALLAMDLADCLTTFANQREVLLPQLDGYTASDWRKPGKHEEYDPFNAYILLRHVLLVDHVHFFNIEKLWLTRKEFL